MRLNHKCNLEILSKTCSIESPPCRTFDHEVRGKYVLQVRVFDNGTPPMYSDSFVTVNIIEESKFAPSVAPLEVHIWSYQVKGSSSTG